MFKKNLFYNSLLSISQFIFPLITFPYSSRILGPGGIGSINFIDSFTQYYVLFAALGIPLYGVREISKRKGKGEELHKTFSEIFSIHLIAAGIFSVVYIAMALAIPKLRVHLDLVAVGIVIIISGVLSAEWLFQGLEEFKYITSRTLIVRTLSVIFLFIFLHTGSPPIIYYAIMASGVLLNGIINLFYIRKLIDIRFKGVALKQHIKPLVIILGSTVAVSVYLLMDNVILGFLQGEAAVGIYATALRIVRLPLALITAVNSVIIPQVSRSYDENKFDNIRQLAAKSFAIICVICFPVMTGMYVSSPFLIHLFAGAKFDGSILALKILAPLILIIGFANIVCVQLLAPMGKEKFLLKVYTISMAFSLLTNVLLIKFYSYPGACAGMILTEALATVLAFRYLRKVISLNIDLKIFFKSMFAAIAFFPIAFLIRQLFNNFNIAETIIIIFCGIFYAACAWFFFNNVYINNLKTSIMNKVFRRSVINQSI